jgi:hypothetical protein
MIDKIEQVIRHAKAASILLDDENVNEVVAKIHAEFLELCWKGADVEQREEARRNLRTLETIKERLKMIVANGREAQRDLDRPK